MRSRKLRTPSSASARSICWERWYNSRRSAPAQKPAGKVLRITRACASSSASRRSLAAKTSSSSSVSDPISLPGSRCKASSTTPSFKLHEMHLPWKSFITALDRLLHAVHVFNLGLEPLPNPITLELAIRGEQAVVDGKGLGTYLKGPYLLVVRQPGVHRVEGRLHLVRRKRSCHQG